MPTDGDFQTAYSALEDQMKALAEAQGDVFLPNPRPASPVQYVLVAMEPSLGGRSPDEVRAMVRAGARNFVSSMEDFILHLAARRYLCRPTERYHVTDLAKGAMPVRRAQAQGRRYDAWLPLLRAELDLVSAPGARVIAVGAAVHGYLERVGLGRPLARVLHYSGQAARARAAAIKGHEEGFRAFRDSVSLADVLGTAGDVLATAGVPPAIRDETLCRVRTGRLTTSRQQLLFHYKTAFEAMLS